MVLDPDLLDHTNFTASNASNFDVDSRGYRSQPIEVPVFPAQNSVIDFPGVNLYDIPESSSLLKFVHGNIIYSLIAPSNEQRFMFIRYSNMKREVFYRFGGRIYCQARTKASYALGPDCMYVCGGKDTNRGRRELWKLDLLTSTWVALHPVGQDLSLSDFPASRWDSSLMVSPQGMYIFGGSTYSEIGNSNIQMNDLWMNTGEGWKILDPESALPHSPGIVVYADSAVVKVVADSKIYSVSTIDGTVTNSPLVGGAPAGIQYSVYMDGSSHFSTTLGLYRWDNTNSKFVKVKNDSVGVGVNSSWEFQSYIRDTTERVRRGQGSSYQPYYQMYRPKVLSASDDTVIEDCDLGVCPIGQYMATCDLPNGKKYSGLGIQDGVFIEDHFIWDGETFHTTKVASSGSKPQERLAAGCCYDEARNCVWVFGGYSGSFYYNDLWKLDLSDYTWTRVKNRVGELFSTTENRKIWPAARAQSGLCVVEGLLWIVSGYSDTQSFSDIWAYNIENGTAYEERTVDWVPFGTDYHVFAWRGRMWLFNGERRKLYRYVYELKQWNGVEIYESRALGALTKKFEEIDAYNSIKDKVKNLKSERDHLPSKGMYLSIRLKALEAALYDMDQSADLEKEVEAELGLSFYLAPLRVSVQLNNLIVSHTSDKGLESFFIDLDAKEIINYPGSIPNASLWRSPSVGMDTAGNVYMYNTSVFDLAETNQVPYFEYSINPLASEYPLSKTSNLMPYNDPTLVGGVSERLAYIDSGNMYVIYDDQVSYDPLIPKVSEHKEGVWAHYWPQVDFSVLDGTSGEEQENSKARVGAGRFRAVPRFMWQRVPTRFTRALRNAALSWKDAEAGRTYVVNNETGKIVRFRSEDGTVLYYPSQIWKESALARRGNLVYSFGGSLLGGPPARNQSGEVPDEYTNLTAQDAHYVLDSHNGFMVYDLDYVAFQARLLAEYPALTPYDYDGMRDYLIRVSNSQGIAREGVIPQDMLAKISNTIYSNTMDLTGGLAARNIVNENGTRPPHPRSAMASTQVGVDLFIGGGAHKFFVVTEEPPKATSCYSTSYINLIDNGTEYPSGETYKYDDFYRFDTSTRTWYKLANLPSVNYGGTLIADKDGQFLWLVGGFTGPNMSLASDKIYKYDIRRDQWNEVGPLPMGYTGRGEPTCEWIGDYNLIIMFGYKGTKGSDSTEFLRLPIADAWMLDTLNGIMYKMFNNQSKMSVIVDGLADSTGWIDMVDFFQPLLYSKFNEVQLNASLNVIGNVGAGLVELGDVAETNQNIPIRLDDTKSGSPDIIWNRIDPIDGSLKHSARVRIPRQEVDYFLPSHIVSVFRDWNHCPWFLINRTDGPAFYRWVKINDFTYDVDFLPIDWPLNLPVSMAAWDGKGKMYMIWNQFNIWELDLRTATYNPDAKYWRQLPPSPDLIDIGFDFSRDPKSYPIHSSIAYNGDLLFYNSEGGVYRFNTTNYVWLVDRMPRNWNYNTVVRDGDEMYYFEPGTTSGVWYSILQCQSDKFYFDSELLEKEIDLPLLKAMLASPEPPNPLASLMSSLGPDLKTLNVQSVADFISGKRATVKRNRVLAFNRNNHLMRAWSRKQGELDLSFEFGKYYPCSRIDISVDYDTMAQSGRFIVDAMTANGLISDTLIPVMEESGYDWDPFGMRYIKQINLPDGTPTNVTSVRPPYYVRMNLPADTSLRNVRVRFSPEAMEYNYIARVNHIGIVSPSSNLNLEDGNGPLSVLYVEPFDHSESDVYTVLIRNDHGTDSARNVTVSLAKNFRVLASIDGNHWYRPTPEDPLVISDVLDPGQSASFYMKAVSYFDKSNIDLILGADYPLAQ